MKAGFRSFFQAVLRTTCLSKSAEIRTGSKKTAKAIRENSDSTISRFSDQFTKKCGCPQTVFIAAKIGAFS